MFWIIIISFAVLMAVAIMIYMMPSESAGLRKKEKKDRARMIANAAKAAEPQKDWQAIAQRWQKQNNALLGDLEKMKIQEKNILKEFEAEKIRNKDVLDKLALEKGWREKEQINLDKARHHEKDLKEQMMRAEKDLEQEHSSRLSAQRELGELKIKCDALSEEKRALSTNARSTF